LRPQGDHASPTDQSLGARLAAANCGVAVEEQTFQRDDAADLDRKLALWKGKVAGLVGATNVPESRQLGEFAERMNLLCFVANNNPTVWQKRKQVFHLGLPTSQTTAAVAEELAGDSGRNRFLLLHDDNEFQQRVAAGLELALSARGKDVRTQQHSPGDKIAIDSAWKPDAIQIIFSSERKALPIIREIRNHALEVPLILGRSLLRQSFLEALGEDAGEIWFIDNAFRRGALRSESQQTFMRVVSANGVDIPTTNHAFGWDGMSFCARALKAADGDTGRAIEYLESGLILEGASGSCSFNPDNHNGRVGLAPTVLTRWTGSRLD
jgi:ABC-type branched-subunit amino acid transport system substrate-binding protein